MTNRMSIRSRSKKRIAIIYNSSWYIYNFKTNLILSLIQNGFEVITIAPSDTYVNKLESLGCQHFSIKLDSKSKNPLVDIKFTISLFLLLKKIQPHVLLNYTAKPNIYGTLAGYVCKIPSINNIAGLGTGFVTETSTTKLLRFLYRISQQRAQKVFFQNQDDLNEFITKNIVSQDKCSVIPGSGVDLSRFNKTPLPPIENKFIFILVSRMLYSKGIQLVYEAAKQLHNNGDNKFIIHLLGESDSNSSDAIPLSVLKSWEKEPFINYLGQTDDVRPHINNAHCIILPSFYREGTPRSILEGLAIGRPVITSNMPGCKTTVIDGINGYLVPPKDIDALRNKMKILMNMNYSKLQEMGKNSRKHAEEKFDEKIVNDKYLFEIQRLI